MSTERQGNIGERKMAEILIGTCGYSYNEWVGPVYPEGSRSEDRLGLYAGLFPTVEIDFSYYAMPKRDNIARMLVAGGPGLSFSIKAYQSLTHKVDPAHWEADAKTYLDAVSPLLDAGRLEAVLFQFPFSFHYEPDRRRYLDKLLSFFDGVPRAVEFRTAEWYNNRVIDSLKKRGIALVSLDLPELKGNPPATDVVTAPFAYVRLHGRNKEAWWGSDATAKFDYSYNDGELEAWGGRLGTMGESAQKILAYFNNHARGQAAKNAQTLEKIIAKIFGQKSLP
jgi:uncharacterized protein YecE (DUF72 family)